MKLNSMTKFTNETTQKKLLQKIDVKLCTTISIHKNSNYYIQLINKKKPFKLVQSYDTVALQLC